MAVRKYKMLLAIVLMCSLIFGSRIFVNGEKAAGEAKPAHDEKQAAQTASTEGNISASADIAETTDGEAQSPDKAELTAVTAVNKAAENGKFELYVDHASGQVRIRDKQTGKEWFSSPPVDRKIPPNNLRLIANTVNVSYTTGKEIVTTYPDKEKAAITTTPINQGISVDYNFESLKLQFTVRYLVTEQGLDVTVPFDSIKEQGNARLTSLELLPFFEASAPNDNGAVFVPDGSGALLQLKPVKQGSFEFYSEYVYGGDHAFQTNVYEKVGANRLENVSKSPREKIALPVFGIYRDEQAFLGIIAEGAADAKINAYPAGVGNIPLYRISAELLYRNNDIIFVGNSGEIPMTEKALIKGDRTVKYILLQGEKANYVGMAESYRSYLMSEQGFTRTENLAPKLQLRLFGGVHQQEVIGKSYVAMTKFEQAKAIVDRFIEQGIDSLEVIYEGWSNGGYLGNQPNHFPAARELGGDAELRKLAGDLESKGVKFSLQANYVQPYSSSKAIKASKDAIRGLNKEVMLIYKPFVTTRQHSSQLYYLLKPDVVLDRFVAKEAQMYQSLGIDGVHLSYMGEVIYSNHSEAAPFRRSQTIEAWTNAMALMRESAGEASVDYGLAYVLGNVDRINNIPMDSSHYDFMDEAVPFYQIAVHGYVPYYAKPANQTDDPRVYKLKLLEFGALPSYQLSFENSANLKRTRVDWLFSTEYDYWVEPASRAYKELMELLGDLSGYAIVNHEIIGKKVNRTTYEDGTQVTVNYNPFEVTVGGKTIAGFGYDIVKGGGQR